VGQTPHPCLSCPMVWGPNVAHHGPDTTPTFVLPHIMVGKLVVLHYCCGVAFTSGPDTTPTFVLPHGVGPKHCPPWARHHTHVSCPTLIYDDQMFWACVLSWQVQLQAPNLYCPALTDYPWCGAQTLPTMGQTPHPRFLPHTHL